MQPESNWRTSTWPRGLLRRGPGKDSALGISAGLGFVLSLWVPGLLTGARSPEENPAAAPPLCAGVHRGDGDCRAIDLGAIERGYRELKEALSRSLTKSLEAPTLALPAGVDAGLPACRRSAARRFLPARVIPEALRGRRFWFLGMAGGRTPRIPPEVQEDPDIRVLVSRIEKLGDLARVSEILGRPVSLAPKGLGEALGVRCVPALVTILREGEVEIHEDP